MNEYKTVTVVLLLESHTVPITGFRQADLTTSHSIQTPKLHSTASLLTNGSTGPHRGILSSSLQWLLIFPSLL